MTHTRAEQPSSVPQQTCASTVAAQLVAEGVEVITGIPGVHNLSLCDALLDHPQLRFIVGRHEQSVTFMANGYARASGKIAVPMVISGPGVTNSLTALADAYRDAVPMVLIAAAPVRAWLGKGAFHELKDQTAAIAAVTKWNTYVERPQDAPQAIRTAFAQAYSDRPGPTVVEIPVDVQEQVCDAPTVPPVARPAPPADAEAVREAARRLATAASPVVLVGGGAQSADPLELAWLLERLQAPCITAALAKGVVPDDHPLNLGCLVERAAGRVFLERADLLLVIGSGLDEVDTRQWTLPLPDRIIQIVTSRADIGRSYPAEIGLVGDVKTVIGQLVGELGALEPVDRASPAPRIAEIRTQVVEEARGRPAWQFIEAMQGVMPADAVVTNDASMANGWVLSFIDRSQPRTMNITRSLAALGYAYPAAVGAKLAHPDRQAVGVSGDGGFLFTSEVLATAVQHRLNAVAVVFNDNGYKSITSLQTGRFGRTVGDDLVNPDFVRLAEAYGAAGALVETPDQLAHNLRAAFERDVPTLIEIPLETGPVSG